MKGLAPTAKSVCADIEQGNVQRAEVRRLSVEMLSEVCGNTGKAVLNKLEKGSLHNFLMELSLHHVNVIF